MSTPPVGTPTNGRKNSLGTPQLEREQGRRVSLGMSIPTPAKNWQDDNSISACPSCSTKFTMLFRRHHCRLCGTVVCAKCSRHKVMIAGQMKPQRACNECYANALTSNPQSTLISSIPDEEYIEGGPEDGMSSPALVLPDDALSRTPTLNASSFPNISEVYISSTTRDVPETASTSSSSANSRRSSLAPSASFSTAPPPLSLAPPSRRTSLHPPLTPSSTLPPSTSTAPTSSLSLAVEPSLTVLPRPTVSADAVLAAETPRSGTAPGVSAAYSPERMRDRRESTSLAIEQDFSAYGASMGTGTGTGMASPIINSPSLVNPVPLSPPLPLMSTTAPTNTSTSTNTTTTTTTTTSIAPAPTSTSAATASAVPSLAIVPAPGPSAAQNAATAAPAIVLINGVAVPAGVCPQHHRRQLWLSTLTLDRVAQHPSLALFSSQVTALHQRVLAREARVEKADGTYVSEQEAVMKTVIAQIEGRKKEVLKQMGFEKGVAEHEERLYGQGLLGEQLEALSLRLTRAKKRRDALVLHKNYPEYGNSGRRWKFRSRGEDGGLSAAHDIILDAIEGNLTVYSGTLGKAVKQHITTYEGVPQGSSFIDIHFDSLKVIVTIDNLRFSGSFLSSLFSPSRLNLEVSIPTMRIPAYFVPATPASSTAPTHPPTDATAGKWVLCEPLREFTFALSKKASGGIQIPDRLINWVVNNAVPKALTEAVEHKLPSIVGSVLAVDGTGILAKGALDIRAECPSPLMDVPLHAPPARDTMVKWRAIKEMCVSDEVEQPNRKNSEGSTASDSVRKNDEKSRKSRPFSVPFEPLQGLSADTLSMLARTHVADMMTCLETVCGKPLPNKPTPKRAAGADTSANAGMGIDTGLSYLQCRLLAMVVAAARLNKVSQNGYGGSDFSNNAVSLRTLAKYICKYGVQFTPYAKTDTSSLSLAQATLYSSHVSPIYGAIEQQAEKERRAEEEMARKTVFIANTKNKYLTGSQDEEEDAQKDVVSFVPDIVSLIREEDAPDRDVSANERKGDREDSGVRTVAGTALSAEDTVSHAQTPAEVPATDEADAEAVLTAASRKKDVIPAAVSCLAERMATPARWPLEDCLGWVSDEFRDIVLAWTTALTSLSTPPDNFLPELAHARIPGDNTVKETTNTASAALADTVDYGVVGTAAKSVLRAIALHGTNTSGIVQTQDQNSGSHYSCICSDLSPLSSDETSAPTPSSTSSSLSTRVCVCGASGVAAVERLQALAIPGVTALAVAADPTLNKDLPHPAAAGAAVSAGAGVGASVSAGSTVVKVDRGPCDCPSCRAHAQGSQASSPHWFAQLLGAVAEVYKGHFTMRLRLRELHVAFPLKKSVDWLLSVTDQRTHIEHMKKRVAEYEHFERVRRYVLSTRSAPALKQQRIERAQTILHNNLAELTTSELKNSIECQVWLKGVCNKVNNLCTNIRALKSSLVMEIAGGDGPLLQMRRLLRDLESRRERELAISQTLSQRKTYISRAYAAIMGARWAAFERECMQEARIINSLRGGDDSEGSVGAVPSASGIGRDNITLSEGTSLLVSADTLPANSTSTTVGTPATTPTPAHPFLSPLGITAQQALPRIVVLALKYRSGLISKARHDELLFQHMRDVELGYTDRPPEADEEGDEVLCEDMLLSPAEAAIIRRLRCQDEERVLLYTADDIYRQRILDHNQALSVHVLNNPDSALNALTHAHMPPYDAQLHLDMSVHALQLNMAAGEVATLVNSHLSEDYDFLAPCGAICMSPTDTGLVGAFAMADPLLPALTYTFPLRVADLELKLFPTRRRALGSLPDVSLSLGALELSGSLVPLLTLDRFMAVYNNYFPGSSKTAKWSLQPPTALITLDSYDDALIGLDDSTTTSITTATASTAPRLGEGGGGGDMGGDERVQQLYDTSKTPILMTERKNPVLPQASLTPFKPCLHADGELTYQAQAAKVAATTMLHDIIQKYIFHPSKCFRFAIRSSLEITRAEGDKGTITEHSNALAYRIPKRPQFAFYPEAHEDIYLPRTAKGDVAAPAWADLPTYPWLQSTLHDQGETEGEELIISIYGKEEDKDAEQLPEMGLQPTPAPGTSSNPTTISGRDTLKTAKNNVFSLSMRLNFQELNEDLILADKLSNIINAGKK